MNARVSDGKLFDDLLDHILLASPLAPRRVIPELFVMKGVSTTARLCSASCIRVLATDVEISASCVSIRQTTHQANYIAALPAYYIHTQLIHTVIASVGRLPLLAMLYAVRCGYSASLSPAANRERDDVDFFNLKGTNLIENTTLQLYLQFPLIQETQDSMNTNPKVVIIEESSVMVPSQIGFGSTETGMLSRGFLRSPRTSLPYKVTVNDREYLAGPNVEMYATPLQRMDFARLGDSAEQQALTYAALGLALGPGEHPTAKIVVGFPVEVMKDEAKAKDVLKALMGWMIGTHRFQINDKDYGITIDKVIVIAQPLGGFYSWAISKEGKFRVSQTEVQGRILVVDIGFNTLDLYALKNMELEPKYTTGDTAGVRRAAELLMQHIQREFDVHISRTEANALLLSDHPIFETAGRGIDLTSVLKQVLDAAATQITDICETTVGNGKQFSRVLFTGGGSELLRKHMLNHFPFALVLPNAVMANASGCAYAGRLKWPNAEVVIGLDPGFGGFKVTALRRCEQAQ